MSFGQLLREGSGGLVAAVLNSLWLAAAIAAGAWVVMRYARGLNAATRHLLWWGVLGAIAVLPLAPAVSRMWPSTPAPVVSDRPTFADVDSAPVPVPATSVSVAQTRPAAPARTAPVEIAGGLWPVVVAGVWTTLFLLQLLRVWASYRHLRGVKARARRAPVEMRRNFDAWMLSCRIHRPVTLLISKEVGSPMAIGIREPAVVLPESLLTEFQETDLDHVLLHELAHMARRDDWTNLTARVAGGLFVLHPVAAWILRRIEHEREMACDDWVVSVTGAAKPYAASLTRLFELCLLRRRLLLASGMAERASQLEQRIEHLLHRTRQLRPRASAASIAAGSAILLAVVIAGAHSPKWMAWAQEPPTQPTHPSTPATVPVHPGLPAPRARSAPPAFVPAPAPPFVDAAPALPDAAPVAAPTPPATQAPQAAATPPPARPQTAPQPAPPATPAPPAAARGSFLAALVAAGYGDLSVDDIVALKQAGISPDYLLELSQPGWGKLTARDMIDLHNREVRPSYMRAISDAKVKDLTLAEVTELASHSVRPELVSEIYASGFGPYTAREIIRLANSGAKPELFRALKDYGFTRVELPELEEAIRYGLAERNLREARQYGTTLTLRQIIKLKNAGVI